MNEMPAHRRIVGTAVLACASWIVASLGWPVGAGALTTAPSVPQSVRAWGGDASAVVVWTPPASNGGIEIHQFTATASPGGQTCTAMTSWRNSCWMNGLSNGVSYTFTVTAHNAAGISPMSAPSNVAVPIAPAEGAYRLVASDGGVFVFGDLGFRGSMGGTLLNRPVVGMANTPLRDGYWLVASDGGIFAFGDATPQAGWPP